MGTSNFVGHDEALRRIRIIPRILAKKKITTVSNNVYRAAEVKVAEPKVVAKAEEVKPQMSETENRLADLLEAAQEMKPLADGVTDAVAEEQANATEPYDDPEYCKEQTAESNEVWEGKLAEPIAEADIPEEKHEETAVAVELPRKKRRGRKGKRAIAAMMATE